MLKTLIKKLKEASKANESKLEQMSGGRRVAEIDPIAFEIGSYSTDFPDQRCEQSKPPAA